MQPIQVRRQLPSFHPSGKAWLSGTVVPSGSVAPPSTIGWSVPPSLERARAAQHSSWGSCDSGELLAMEELPHATGKTDLREVCCSAGSSYLSSESEGADESRDRGRGR